METKLWVTLKIAVRNGTDTGRDGLIQFEVRSSIATNRHWRFGPLSAEQPVHQAIAISHICCPNFERLEILKLRSGHWSSLLVDCESAVQVPNHRRLKRGWTEDTIAGIPPVIYKSLLTRFLPAHPGSPSDPVLIAELFAQIVVISDRWRAAAFAVLTVFVHTQEIHKFADYFALFAGGCESQLTLCGEVCYGHSNGRKVYGMARRLVYRSNQRNMLFPANVVLAIHLLLCYEFFGRFSIEQNLAKTKTLAEPSCSLKLFSGRGFESINALKSVGCSS